MSIPAAVCAAYELDDEAPTAISVGWINRTFVAKRGGAPLVVQALHPIFRGEVNLDIEAITARLAARGLETPRLVRTAGGAPWIEADGVWRALTYVEGETHASLTPTQAREAAALVGRFHRALEGFEHTFHFSRPGAHDTPKHLAKLRGLLDAAPDHEDAPLARAVLDAAASLPTLPPLPTRIVHGDLKATNLRFDGDRARCLLDLDTLAHGSLAVELGDALRSWCNASNEADPEARFDPTIFAAALEGWAPVVRDLVTEAERRSLVGGVETITLELASRFAADLFEDRYFGWDEARFDSRRAHNRARTHAHLSLARSLRAQRDALEARVERAFR